MGRKETLGQDSEGRYRRYIGYKNGNGGKMIQHLFRLGRDEAAAKTANVRLEQLWECVVARWRRLKGEGKTDEPSPVWDDTTLAIGHAIAKGEDSLTLQPLIPSLAGDRAGAYLEALRLVELQKDFPVIVLRLPESVEERAVSFATPKPIPKDDREILATLGQPRQPKDSGQRLHQALDAYSAYVAEKNKSKPSGRGQLGNIARLKAHAEDAPLSGLDADKVETWLAYWCARPNSEETERPFAEHTCRNALIHLRSFLRWLNRSSAFQWVFPAGFVFPRCRIKRLPEDRVKRRAYWKRSELKVVWEYAKPWERALILLGLNCGFSKKEIATLQLGEVVRRKGEAYVTRYRTKTDVYGEWILWPETVKALEFLGHYRTAASGTYAVVNTAGTPMDSQTTGKRNENQVIKNHWDNLMKRILKDFPDFHKLPFKHLRKTGATFIRHMNIKNAAEVASMYLSHGDKADSKDQLLGVYTSRPWKRVHAALGRLRRKLLPLFDSVPDPWTYRTVRRSTPVMVAKIKELRTAGKTLKVIAQEVGLHEMTVGKILRRK
jgi:integrase